jgi:hypothetical protein
MIKTYCNQTIQLIIPAAVDQWGEPTGSETIEEVKGRVDWNNKLVRDENGEQVVAAAIVLLNYDQPVTFTHKIRIGNVDHPIIAINREQDWSTRYWELAIK